MGGQKAQAQLDSGVFAPLFVTSSAWSGYGLSSIAPSVRGDSSLSVTGQSGRLFTGQFVFNSQTTAYQGTVASDGSLSLQGAVGTGFQASGAAVALADGGFVTRFSYRLGRSDAGTVEMLHLYPYAAAFHAFPPGPCDGAYNGGDGAIGAMAFTRTDTRTPPTQTTAFHGTLNFGNGTYDAIGTISPAINRDGSYTFDLVGQPSTFIPCVFPPNIRVMGRYLPGTTLGAPARFAGQYALIDPSGIQTQGGTFTLTAR